MSTLSLPLHDLCALADSASSSSNSLRELTVSFDECARHLAHPAAFLDAGMVFLALNRQYARMVGLPPSAIVGKDYAKVHKDTQDMLRILQCSAQGEVCAAQLVKSVSVEDGAVCRSRTVIPVKNADSLVLGILIEYHLDTAPLGDATD